MAKKRSGKREGKRDGKRDGKRNGVLVYALLLTAAFSLRVAVARLLPNDTRMMARCTPRLRETCSNSMCIPTRANRLTGQR